ncbi:DUF6774 domain-containing protein [Oscillibacter sp.]|uniref:DUF6774 domain-containing protein n=1 Tax=Oscillibacter sp. TaxID=1945593 RepID=UPI0033935952
MDNFCCDPLALTMAINSLSVALAKNLSDDELDLLIAVISQLGGTLTTIAVQRHICNNEP